MKRTNKERCAELNKMLSDAKIKNFFFGLAPKGYWPYRLYESYEHGVFTYAGGYYKEVRAMAVRMSMAVTTNKTITSDVIFGCQKTNSDLKF